MEKKITKSLAHEFNVLMANNGSIIRLEYIQQPFYAMFKVCPCNMLYIDSYILNPTEEFYEILENFFKNKDIKLSYNNTHTIFWCSDDLK